MNWSRGRRVTQLMSGQPTGILVWMLSNHPHVKQRTPLLSAENPYFPLPQTQKQNSYRRIITHTLSFEHQILVKQVVLYLSDYDYDYWEVKTRFTSDTN